MREKIKSPEFNKVLDNLTEAQFKKVVSKIDYLTEPPMIDIFQLTKGIEQLVLGNVVTTSLNTEANQAEVRELLIGLHNKVDGSRNLAWTLFKLGLLVSIVIGFLFLPQFTGLK